MPSTFHYIGFGLRIAADVPFPELPPAPAGGECDLAIRFAGAGPADLESTKWLMRIEASTREPWLCCARTADGYLLRFPGVADLFVDARGRAIECRSANVPAGDLNLHHLVLDHVMPLALKLRGEEALHATAVRTAQGVCAFIGPSGSGKSTLAAAFLDAGEQVLSDDCLRVIIREGRVFVVPAYPGVRLLDDACETFASGASTTLLAGTFTTKRRWAPESARAGFSSEAQPLARVYRLDRTSALTGERRIERLAVRDAFMELVASTFRFDALDRQMLTAEFETWSHVARTVPVCRLGLDDDIRGAGARARVLADLSA